MRRVGLRETRLLVADLLPLEAVDLTQERSGGEAVALDSLEGGLVLGAHLCLGGLRQAALPAADVRLLRTDLAFEEGVGGLLLLDTQEAAQEAVAAAVGRALDEPVEAQGQHPLRRKLRQRGLDPPHAPLPPPNALGPCPG